MNPSTSKGPSPSIPTTIVVIPCAKVQETIALATDKVRREDSSRAELKAGGYLRDVFQKYGVL